MIQPSVLTAIARNPEFRGKGLLARFLYARPASKVGHRLIGPPPVTEEVRKSYHDVVSKLAFEMTQRTGLTAVTLTLTEGAHAGLRRLEEEVEPTLAGDGELAHLRDWGSKYVGAVGLLAGILHMADHPADGLTRKVQEETFQRAVRLGEYFKAVAINSFTEMVTDEATADAIYLLERVMGMGQSEVSERDVHVSSRSRFKTKTELKPALDRLVEHGYLVPLLDAKPTGGRPSSPLYRINELT
jgi:replicative DNA helicase